MNTTVLIERTFSYLVLLCFIPVFHQRFSASFAVFHERYINSLLQSDFSATGSLEPHSFLHGIASFGRTVGFIKGHSGFVPVLRSSTCTNSAFADRRNCAQAGRLIRPEPIHVGALHCCIEDETFEKCRKM
jgi:hypothetical protein